MLGLAGQSSAAGSVAGGAYGLSANVNALLAPVSIGAMPSVSLPPEGGGPFTESLLSGSAAGLASVRLAELRTQGNSGIGSAKSSATTLEAGVAELVAQRAAGAGVVVAAAAGNDGVPLCAQPLLRTKILCVGAVDRANTLASYSNYAVRVDLVAPGGERRPGEAVSSTQLGGGYSAMAGTSQATPHVAAAAALLVSLGLRGRAVIDRLEQTATPLGSAAQLGHGLVNMEAAVAGLTASHPAPPPRLVATAAKRARMATVLRPA